MDLRVIGWAMFLRQRYLLWMEMGATPTEAAILAEMDGLTVANLRYLHDWLEKLP